MKIPTKYAERFWSKVRKTDDCWVWTASCYDERGYGAFAIKRKIYRAHRISFMLAYGIIPDGMHVLHKCDNPACVRPDHLFLGTDKDNVADAMGKGRHKYPANIGTDNPQAKLNEDKVRVIRHRYSQGGITYRELAEQHGVVQSTIKELVLLRTWKHVK